jgi:hypothetical protein
MRVSCNCTEVLEKYLCDIPSKWRTQIITTICNSIDEDKDLNCEEVAKCETLTTFSAFTMVGNIISITYRDEEGIEWVRSFDFTSIISNPVINVDSKCIAPQDTWDSWTYQQQIQALVDYDCNCCSTTTTTTAIPPISTTTTTTLPCEPVHDLQATIEWDGIGQFTFTPPGFTPPSGYIWEVVDDSVSPVVIYASGVLPQSADGSATVFTTSPNAYGVSGLKLIVYSTCAQDVLVTSVITQPTTTTSTTSSTTTTTSTTSTSTTTTSSTTTTTTIFPTTTTTTSTTTTTTLPILSGRFQLTCIGHNDCTQQGVARLIFTFDSPTAEAITLKYGACYETNWGLKECYGCTDNVPDGGHVPPGAGCFPTNNPAATIVIPLGVTSYDTGNLSWPGPGYNYSIPCQPCNWTYKQHFMKVTSNPSLTLNLTPPVGSTFTQIS